MIERTFRLSAAVLAALLAMTAVALFAGCGPLDGEAVGSDPVTAQQRALDFSMPINQQMALDDLLLSNKVPGPNATEMHFFPCVHEYETCFIGGPRLVAFGLDGGFSRFVFTNVSGTFACDRSTFGNRDPSPGNIKSCWVSNYGVIASEGGSATVPDSEIAYGANGLFVYQRRSGTVSCDNNTFTDPYPGVPKACYRLLPNYVLAASQGQVLSGLDHTPIAFGSFGLHNYFEMSGTITCDFATFGLPTSELPDNPVCFKLPNRYRAEEGNPFSGVGGMPPTTYYGSWQNGVFLPKVIGAGSCTNETFGGDPMVNFPKQCFGGQ